MIKCNNQSLSSFIFFLESSYFCFPELPLHSFWKFIPGDVLVDSLDFLFAFPFVLLWMLLINVNSIFEIIFDCVSHTIRYLLQLLQGCDILQLRSVEIFWNLKQKDFLFGHFVIVVFLLN